MFNLTYLTKNQLKTIVNRFNDKEGCNCKIVESDATLFPSIDDNGTIYFSNRLEIPLLLFTAYHDSPDSIHEVLFWYLLACKQVEDHNFDYADVCIDQFHQALPKNDFSSPSLINQDVYLDIQFTVILAHELGHYLFQITPQKQIPYCETIRDLVVSSIPNNIKGLLNKKMILSILDDDSMMEELSCDFYAMEVISDFLNEESYDEDEMELIFHQIVRIFISLKYLEEISPSNYTNIRRRNFNGLRSAIISVALNQQFEQMTASILKDEIHAYKERLNQARQKVIRKIVFHHFKKLQKETQSKLSQEYVFNRLKNEEDILKDILLSESLYNNAYYQSSTLDVSFDLDNDDTDELFQNYIELYKSILEGD